MNSNTDKTPLVISYLFTGESFFLALDKQDHQILISARYTDL